MIKKTFLVTLVLVLAYAAFIKWKPQMQATQHQWQENTIKAQTFVYEKHDADKNVIIGSSLSCRIIMDSLPGFTNISFAGQGVFDGLNIIAHKKDPPQRVFIETNILLRELNEGFDNSLFNPFLFGMRKYIPSLRDGRQPMGIAGSYVTNMVGRLINKVKPKPVPVAAGSKEQKTDGLFDKLLAHEADYYFNAPDPKKLKDCLNNLKLQVEVLQMKGVKVVFFEMPINPKLCGLPLAVSLRENLHVYFPANKYSYIPQPDCKDYTTADGIHLTRVDAQRYSSYFRSQALNK